MTERYGVHDIAVAGGALRVGVWEAGGPTVLALHGITSHHLAFPFLAAALPEHRVVAPDLRGRGRSRDLPGPYGMAAHADDAAAVVRAVAAGPVTVVGHSMGAFVAVVLAHRHPELVERLVLVDGGLPFAPAEQATTLQGLAAIRTRLETTFASSAEYADFYRAHPAFAHDWAPEVAAYAAYDLVGETPALRPAARVEAVVADQIDIVENGDLEAALAHLPDPTVFLHAPRGFVDDPPGLYAGETVAGLRERWPVVDVHPVPDVNHYTIVLSPRGAAAVAAVVPGPDGPGS